MNKWSENKQKLLNYVRKEVLEYMKKSNDPALPWSNNFLHPYNMKYYVDFKKCNGCLHNRKCHGGYFDHKNNNGITTVYIIVCNNNIKDKSDADDVFTMIHEFGHFTLFMNDKNNLTTQINKIKTELLANYYGIIKCGKELCFSRTDHIYFWVKQIPHIWSYVYNYLLIIPT
jgi:hypothetical protein